MNTAMCFMKPTSTGNRNLMKSIRVPKVITQVWSTLFDSRWPMSDPSSLTHGVFLTNVEQGFQTVAFNSQNIKGEYIETNMEVSDAVANGSVPMNWDSLQNNINVNTGLYIPDKLPDEND